MLNLFYDCYTALNKVYSEKAFIKQALSDTPAEEKNRAAMTKICYGVLDKDAELSYYIAALTEKTPKLAVRTILKIAEYSIKYLGKKDYAVIKNAVELTKRLGKAGASGFVNAFLRKFVATEIPLPDKGAARLAVRYSYPEFVVNALVARYGEARAEKIMSAPPPGTALVFYGTDGRRYLEEKGVTFSETPFTGVFTARRFTRNADYDSGLYTFQSLGSVAICETVKPCDRLLDCCAAPGGKSVRLSYKCKEITAWDIHPHRTELIESYKRRMGRDNITVGCADAKIFDGRFAEYFDAVLADAPCSGMGVASENPDIKLNRTERDVASLNEEQLAILNNVCKYVKKGGYLHYSTCSVLPCENEDICEKFLSAHPEFTAEDISSALPHVKSGAGITFLPDESGGAGFFTARFKKAGD